MDFGGMFARLSDLAGDAALVAGDDAEISARTVAVIRLNHVVEQILFRLVGEVDKRGTAQKSGERSTARLLQALSDIPHRQTSPESRGSADSSALQAL